MLLDGHEDAKTGSGCDENRILLQKKNRLLERAGGSTPVVSQDYSWAFGSL